MIFKEGCPLCGGELYSGTSTFTVDRKQVLVVVRNVPASVCRQCGEAWIGDDIAGQLEQIVTNAKNKRSQMEVVDMAA
jgi:YgiT-type zinc finger domain-containing protein